MSGHILPGPVGRYELRARLAGDAFDEAYEGFDPLLERPVIIKVFPIAGVDAEPAARLRDIFSRQMQRVGLLTHPAIVSLFDAGFLAEGAFMASEFVEGGSLADVLTNGSTLDLLLRVSIVIQIVDALEHAREQGVPHLDLKPTSVRVGNDFLLKVGSFGVATVVDALADASGTERPRTRFAAPERVQGLPGDTRADVFSIARIALDLLAPGTDPVSPSAGVAMPPDLVERGVTPAAWTALWSRALAPIPDARFATPGEFSLDLLMTLRLGEAEARLAWETSRTLGVLAQTELLGSASSGSPVADGDGATMIASARRSDDRRPSSASRPTGAAESSEAETVIGAVAPEGVPEGPPEGPPEGSTGPADS